MRFISTKTHGILDYLMGALLILAPWLLGFANDGPATYVPIALGIMVIIYSLLTDYELGVARLFSMRGHLYMDLLGGIFLAASPWLFGFSETVYLPHLLFGLLEIGASLMTKQEPYPTVDRREHAH